MRARSLILLSVLALGIHCGHAVQAAPARVPLTAKSDFVFAEPTAARAVLTGRDEFLGSLSPFDRSVRLRTPKPVSEAEFVRFLGESVRPWQPGEIEKLRPIVASLRTRLARFTLNLPAEVLLVKTSGKEEEGTNYTRANAIVLPEATLALPPGQVENVLAHELFHVLTRHDRAVRERLYAVVGFRPCSEIAYPAVLASRRITNPDAPRLDTYIEVQTAGTVTPAVPVLYARIEQSEIAPDRPFFSYLVFRLMEIERRDGRCTARLNNGQPILLDPTAVDNFVEQIGRNTQYVIHPDEVLADNFVFLLRERPRLPDPRIPEKMAEILR